MIFMKKIFFFDIDGTIVDHARNLHTVSAKTKFAMQDLMNQGHIVMIASGRCKCLLSSEILHLPLSGFLLANGAYAELDGKVIFKKSIPFDKLCYLAEYCRQHNFIYYFEAVDHIYTNGKYTKRYYEFNAGWGTDIQIYTDRPLTREDPITNAMVFCQDYLSGEQMVNELKPFFDFRLHKGFSSYDVGTYDVHKGSGVSELLSILDIPKYCSYSFGDGLNDTEMFDAVGHAIAMANAETELKKHADAFTTDVLEEGVYHYLRKENLISIFIS